MKKGDKMIECTRNLWAKFKAMDEDTTYLTYVPVLGWQNKENDEVIGMVPQSNGLNDSYMLYTIDHHQVRKNYGKFIGYYFNDIEAAIAKSKEKAENNEDLIVEVYNW